MADNQNTTSWWKFRCPEESAFGFSWVCFGVTMCFIALQSPQLFSAGAWSPRWTVAYGAIMGGLVTWFAIPVVFAYVAWKFSGRSRHAATSAYCLVAVALFTMNRFGEMRTAKASAAQQELRQVSPEVRNPQTKSRRGTGPQPDPWAEFDDVIVVPSRSRR